MDDLINRIPKIYKRVPYRNHKSHTESIPKVIDALKKCKKGDLCRIAFRTNISINTLKNWKKKLKDDSTFSPCNPQIRKSRRIFLPQEEESIAGFIQENIIKPGYFFTNDDFRDLINSEYLRKYRDSENIIQFQASSGYISSFKKKYRISSRKCHIRRRPKAASFDEQFVNKIEMLKQTQDNDLIINIDETSWQLFPNNLLIWHCKNEDHAVCYMDKANPKDCITVIAGITASGTKLPLMFVAEGVSERCENSQIGNVEPHWKYHSENGWVTEEVFLHYITTLREHYGGIDGPRLFLILDVYPSHKTEDVKNFAVGLNIELIYVPAGQTDEYQPLDRYAFGCLKAMARKLFRKRIQDNRALIRTKSDAVQDMICAWERLSKEIIDKCWEYGCFNSDDIS